MQWQGRRVLIVHRTHGSSGVLCVTSNRPARSPRWPRPVKLIVRHAVLRCFPYFEEKRNTVCERKTEFGFSSVLGKFG